MARCLGKLWRKHATVVAVALNLLCSPFIAMLYLGQGIRGCIYLAALTVVPIVVGCAFSTSSTLGAVYTFLVFIVGIVHTYFVARRGRHTRRWYSRWYILIALYFFFGISYTLSALTVSDCRQVALSELGAWDGSSIQNGPGW